MLKKRIEILMDAGVISKEVDDFVCRVIDEELHRFKEKQDLLEMFTTHLAIAAQRVYTNQEVEVMENMIWKEVCSCSVLNQAEALYEQIAAYAPCVFPEEEKRFLIMHLCNLFQ